ncbi:PREDICTED: TBC1 domain family member 20-like isoform X3 [Amphimedon queenslandica]|uniref:Rab-GAP TBC domain-containing protein n=1 Tax=Amphimedon queenslandica TaxID=400682 RepID=A0AAN0JL24_AMPQE|nr:PREDICTED: TBC1 domain family member 20-like isoform X3 [Amphimedon queenslandica]|eukprot:XP_019857722.1 PREDICTED: TBC1 domain family member 20-like isoform X3 [Amphimedon queenslandica]
MNVLVQYLIRDFLYPDIGRTKEIMSYIRPLLRINDSQLESFITRSECEYYFSLSWILTWHSHVVYDRDDLLMLTDLFLAFHPLIPIYVATVVRSEVLEQDCEMSSIHGFLLKFPEEFDVNELVHNSVELFNKIPAHKIASTGNIRLNSRLISFGSIMTRNTLSGSWSY